MTNRLTFVVLVMAAALHGAGQVRADWPQFLGPRRNAVSEEQGLNWDWKAKPPQVVWKVPLGNGFSSVAVVGDRLFTLAKRGARDVVVCLGVKDGSEIWSYDAAPSYIDLQRQGAGPRSTPTYHEGKVYCLFAQGELLCLTADGKLVWERNIFKDAGAAAPPSIFYWGVALSPLVEGNLVVVQPGGDKNSSVTAYHKSTGQIVWQTGSDPIGYASPIAITAHGARQIVCPTGTSYLGIEPVKGGILWRYEFGNPYKTNCANPIWSNDRLFVSAAYATGAAVLDLVKSSPNTWDVKEKWRNKKIMQNLFATSIVLDKHVYGCSGDLQTKFLRCLDLDTGKLNWEERLPGLTHLLAADGRILLWEEHGNLSYFNVSSKVFETQGEMKGLLSFKAWAAPALAAGRLYLRNDNHLLCLDLR